MGFEIFISLLANNWHVMLLFFLIATLYSSVGFGGGSSYLAILALTGIAFTEIRFISLLCNIAVVGGNVFYFQNQKLYNWNKVIPIVLFSVPMAFIGGALRITESFFFMLLGCTLLFSAITMGLSKKMTVNKKSTHDLSFYKNASYGGGIGFISGMVGIGGGIFLAPLLYIIQWDSPKKIAATASMFILLNSISGIVGQSINPSFSIQWNLTILLVLTVILGGFLGTRISNRYFSPIQLKRCTAVLIALISLRILINHL